MFLKAQFQFGVGLSEKQIHRADLILTHTIFDFQFVDYSFKMDGLKASCFLKGAF